MNNITARYTYCKIMLSNILHYTHDYHISLWICKHQNVELQLQIAFIIYIQSSILA